MREHAAVFFILLWLAIPLAGAVEAEGTWQPGPVGTGQDLNRTGFDIANHTFSSEYEKPPTLVDVKVEITEKSLPAPKGEMASGPRTIGFAGDPVSLAVLGIAILAVIAGVWYFARRKHGDAEKKDEE